jgi:hypothetical protein
MKSILLLIFYVIININFSFAQTKKEFQLSNKEVKKLSKNDFLDHYAGPDTMKAAIIEYYFHYHNRGYKKIVGMPLAFLYGTAMIALSITSKNKQVASLSYYGGLFGLAATAFSVPAFVKGLKQIKKYNKKELYKLLGDFDSGKVELKSYYENIQSDEFFDEE